MRRKNKQDIIYKETHTYSKQRENMHIYLQFLFKMIVHKAL